MAEPSTTQTVRRVLIVAPQGDIGALVGNLPPAAQREVVTSLRDALERLRPGHDYQLVLIDPRALQGDLLAAGPESAWRILADLPHPVCTVDARGQVVWSNRAFAACSAPVQQAIGALCRERLTTLANEAEAAGVARCEPLEVNHHHGYDVSLTPLRDRDGSLRGVLALAWARLPAHTLQSQLDAIDAAGRELLGIDPEQIREMDVSERIAFLENKIIRFCRDLLHFDHFAILLVDPRTQRLETLIASGITEADRLNIYAREEGNGICGYVAATGRSYICPDVSKDPRYLPGLESACSSLTVPLELNDKVIGVLNVESDRPNAFAEQDRQFAELFARYVALALHILRLLLAERRAASGQVAADVDSEVARPLNDIVSDVAAIMEDYRDDERLRRRLKAVLDDVDRVRTAIRQAAEQPAVPGTSDQEPQTDPLLGGKRVLVADDEEIICETISDVLASRGALVTQARDGNEAIRLLRAQRMDLVLSDIKMPNRNGYEVFAAAREANPDCAVILITGFGYDPEHSIVRASKEGLAGVLFKPFKVEKLLEQVHRALAGR